MEEFPKQRAPDCVWRVKKVVMIVITGYMKR